MIEEKRFGRVFLDGEFARRPRLLIVDDHPSYAQGIASLLMALGELDVIGLASHPEEALEQTRTAKPDLVLMDIRLPERSGIELTRTICSEEALTKVVILTASTEVADVREAMKAGARGYLLKQSDAGQLLAAIEAIWAGETVIDSSLMASLMGAEAADLELTECEIALLKLLARGLELSAIAKQTSVSESTVKRQIVQLQKKLGADNRIQAVVTATVRGLLSP